MRKSLLPALVATEKALGLGDAVGLAGPSSLLSTSPHTLK